MGSCAAVDTRSPFVIGVHDLYHHPGEVKPVKTTVSAPPDFGSGLTAVAEGDDIGLDLRFESVLEGIYVSGTVKAVANAECGRCLDPFEINVDVELQELFSYESQAHAEERDDQLVIQDEQIDLEPVVRDAIVTVLPFQPICREDCPGIVAPAGTTLHLDEAEEADMIDPRWAALSGLLEDQSKDEREES